MSLRNPMKPPITMGSLLILLSSYYLLFSPVIAANLKISCPHGQLAFKIELARTPQELAKGLMHRKSLGQDEGMLFCFPEPGPINMWMKNTPLSLDMIFINPKGEIVAIEENTTPYSTKLIGPVENTAQVLELSGGTAKKTGISKACSVQLGD